MNSELDNIDFGQFQTFNSFIDIIIQQNEKINIDKIIEEFELYIRKQLDSDEINKSNGMFSRKNYICVDEYLNQLYINLNQEIYKLPDNKALINYEFISKLICMIENFKVNKSSNIQKIKEVLRLVTEQRIKKYLSFFKLDRQTENEIIRELIEETIRSGKLKNAVFYVKEFNYIERDLLLDLIQIIASKNIGVELVKSLTELDCSIQEQAIRILIDKYHINQATEIYISSGIKDENLESLINYKLKKKLFHNFFSLLKSKKININQIEDLFSEDVQLINLLINKLVEKNKEYKALYVLYQNDFNNVTVGLNNLRKIYDYIVRMNKYKFLKSHSVTLKNLKELFKIQKNIKLNLIDDSFAPVTENCYQLDFDYSKIRYVQNEESIDYLEELKEAEVIGVDSEWYPYNNQFIKNCAAIMQLASSNSILIIDFISLGENERLVKKLERVLENKKILGFHIKNDLKMMPPKIKDIFVNKTNIINLEEEIKKKFPDKKLNSLSSTVKHFFNKDLCKTFQISNWKKRPLTLRKLHYSALDAFILVNIYNLIS